MKDTYNCSYYIKMPNGERLEVASAPLPTVGSALKIRDKLYLVGDITIEFMEDKVLRAPASILFGEYVVELK